MKNIKQFGNFINEEQHKGIWINANLKENEFGEPLSTINDIVPNQDYIIYDGGMDEWIGNYKFEHVLFRSTNQFDEDNTLKLPIQHIQDLLDKGLILLQKNDGAMSENVINEDGDGGGGGVAMASSGTTSGMGNVVSAQPASVAGAAVTGDGTTGSGDYGNPLFPTAQKDGSTKLGKKKGKKKDKKKESVIQNFLAQYKGDKDKNKSTGSKMFSFNDFVNNDIKK